MDLHFASTRGRSLFSSTNLFFFFFCMESGLAGKESAGMNEQPKTGCRAGTPKDSAEGSPHLQSNSFEKDSNQTVNHW